MIHFHMQRFKCMDFMVNELHFFKKKNKMENMDKMQRSNYQILCTYYITTQHFCIYSTDQMQGIMCTRLSVRAIAFVSVFEHVCLCMRMHSSLRANPFVSTCEHVHLHVRTRLSPNENAFVSACKHVLLSKWQRPLLLQEMSVYFTAV